MVHLRIVWVRLGWEHSIGTDRWWKRRWGRWWLWEILGEAGQDPLRDVVWWAGPYLIDTGNGNHYVQVRAWWRWQKGSWELTRDLNGWEP